MSSELPEGWRQVSLGSIARIVTGGTPSRSEPAFWGGDIPWMSSGEVNQRQVCHTSESITALGMSKSNASLLPPNTIMMALNGQGKTRGKVAVLRIPATCNQSLAGIILDKELADFEYILYHLESQYHNIRNLTGDDARNGLNLNIVRSLIISLPSVSEQRRIAEVLRSIDEQAALSRRTLTATSATKNAALIAAIHSNSWPCVQVGEILAATRAPMRSGPFGSALLKSELTERGIPLLGIDNVHVERFVPDYRRFLSEAKYQELARYTVFPNDVMVTIMGTVGRCCVVPEDVGCAISSKHVWTLTLDEQRYSPALLAWQINHEPRVLGQLRGSAQGGIMSAISSETLRNLRVSKPPRAQMLELEQLIISANSTISRLEKELVGLTRLKRLVAADLLSGRVRVPA